MLMNKVKNSTGTGIGTYKNDLSVELEKLYTKLSQASDAYSVFTPKYNKLVSDCKQINFADYGLLNNSAYWFSIYDIVIIEFHKVREELHKVREAYKPPPQSLQSSSPPPPHESIMAQPQTADPQAHTGTMNEAAHTTTTTASAAASVDADAKDHPHTQYTNTELAMDALPLAARYPPG